jgi:hypothetical protein
VTIVGVLQVATPTVTNESYIGVLCVSCATSEVVSPVSQAVSEMIENYLEESK